MTRNQNKGVLIVALVLVLAAIGLVIAVTAFAFKKADDMSYDGGSASGGSSPTLSTSSASIPQSSFAMSSWKFDRDSFQMMGYDYRDKADGRGIRFYVNIPSDLKEAAEENSGCYKFGFILVPVDWFAEIEALYEPGESIDWYAALLEQGKQPGDFLYGVYGISYATKDSIDGKEVNYMRITVVNIKARNTLKPMTCIWFVDRYATSNSEDFVREYATYPEGKNYASFGVTCARVCGEALNDYTSGLVSYSDETVADLLKYMDYAIDIANGKDPTDDTFSSIVLKAPSANVTLNLGENARISYEIEPSAELLDIPVRWLSSNENVVKVDPDGTVHSVGYGEATVSIHVGGVTKSYKFIVTGTKEEVLAHLRKDYDKYFALMTGTAPDGSTVQLTYTDLAAYARRFLSEIWNEEDYSVTTKSIVEAAQHFGAEGDSVQELDSMNLYVFSYGARAALADFAAEADSEHTHEMQYLGHTLYSRFSEAERTELQKVAEYDGW